MTPSLFLVPRMWAVRVVGSGALCCRTEVTFMAKHRATEPLGPWSFTGAAFGLCLQPWGTL